MKTDHSFFQMECALRRHVLILLSLLGLCLLRFGASFDAAYSTLVLFLLYRIGSEDLARRIIPNQLLLCGFLIRCFLLLSSREAFGIRLVSAMAVSFAAAFLSILFRTVTKRKWIGGGDIKLLFLLTLYLGFTKSLYMLALACLGFLLAALAAYEKRRGSAFLLTTLPFGPFLCAATAYFLLF